MWEVVGFKIREVKEKRYCDIYCVRKKDGITGQETFHGNYNMETVKYEPCLGDCILISTGSYNGRTYISDIVM